MSGSPLLRSDGSPASDRRAAVLRAITSALSGPGTPVLLARRSHATDAALAALDDGGWLAPLPGEREAQLAAFLADVERGLDQKGARRVRA